LKALGLP